MCGRVMLTVAIGLVWSLISPMITALLDAPTYIAMQLLPIYPSEAAFLNAFHLVWALLSTVVAAGLFAVALGAVNRSRKLGMWLVFVVAAAAGSLLIWPLGDDGLIGRALWLWPLEYRPATWLGPLAVGAFMWLLARAKSQGGQYEVAP